MARRPQCSACMRPETHCVCPYIKIVAHRTQILVLQHPDEFKHPLNTARLAILGLAHAQCWVGEHFPDLAPRLQSASRPALLFPGPAARTPQQWRDQAPACLPDLLIVPDGTWRQAGRLVRENACLAELPRLVLEPGAVSRYRVRHAQRDDAVSTIEAITHTLAALEPETDFTPLLRPFEAMIENQIRAMGEPAYTRHLALSAKRSISKR
ncbi:DTW domain-containing protein [Pusillimonas sp. CC-YST705]|uniref:tRNA-uridine aminocarboxypropyltransferase n=1 Tax=Mesopusillimonas faecipullorum TaxID=2755040 RepID=A0ABS8CBG5_9BURK|nr:tRNA-uridine aminocarboxypropyltransferase [Mesopusillimonas faecipullorum]MCB5363365.1 DTW domain-containing protein [Mesopusillimonas faecipullorum]